MEKELEQFLKSGAAQKFMSLTENTPNTFGKMNVLQMLEHVAEWASISSGKLKFELQTPIEHLPNWKAFLLSEKEFMPNTKNSLMDDEPLQSSFESVEEGVLKIQKSLDAYFERFKNKELETEMHPFFGALNFEEWALLHGKHLRHHLRQFGVNF